MSSVKSTFYRVLIRENLVRGIERVPASDDIEVPESALDVSSQLARNTMENGCLDGEYFFDDAEAARHFAGLALDFLTKLVEKSSESLQSAHVSAEGWSNPHALSGKTTKD